MWWKKKNNINTSSDTYQVRYKVILVIFSLLFGTSILRQAQLQFFTDSRVANLLQSQYQKTISVRAKRGFIYDRNKEELAITVMLNSVFAEPRHIPANEKSKVATKLAKALSLNKKIIEKKLKSNKSFVWIKRQISEEETKKMQKLELAFVHLQPEGKRYYPNGSLAGQIIGFTGIDSNGLEGIEARYDTYLKGKELQLSVSQDAHGRKFAWQRTTQSGSLEGASVYLTIDKQIQYILENEMKAQLEISQAKSAMGIIIDPFDGRILAMANIPEFDPNIISSKNLMFKRNKVVADTYEPGSTFKSFIMSAALERSVVSLKEKIDCEKGLLKIGRRSIKDTHPYELLTPLEIMRSSSNIGTYKIAQRLGKEEVYRYLTNLGIGLPTMIDFPGEASGVLAKPETWKEIRFSNIAFGQGVSVTMLQMASAINSIANGGYLIQPYLVDKVIDQDGNTVYQHTGNVPIRVFSKSTTSEVTKMLEAVIYAEGGTGGQGKINQYGVAGKTGTSEKYDPEVKGYSSDKRIASFIGFVPSQNPKLTMLIVVDEPTKGSRHGGSVAAPIFAKTGSQVLKYLGVTPTLTDAITNGDNKLPNFSSTENESDRTDVQEEDAIHQITVQTNKDNQQVPVSPETNTEIELAGETSQSPDQPTNETQPTKNYFVEQEDNAIQVLDLTGSSIRKVLREARSYHINFKVKGNGIIYKHEPPANSLIKEGGQLTLYCK